MLTPTEEDQRRQVTIEQAEADYFAGVEEELLEVKRILDREGKRKRLRKALRKDAEQRLEALQKPFGYGNGEWEALKAQMQPGDELWEWCTSRASWNARMGNAGYELVRDGKYIASHVCAMN